MSWPRRHLAAVLAVLLALAVGIAVGGGPLGDALGSAAGASGRAGDTGSDTGSDTGNDGGTDHDAAVLGSRFADAVAPALYAGRLAGHPVALVTLPGASEHTIAGIEDQVAAAGGTVTGRYGVGAGLLASSQTTLIDTLGTSLSTSHRGGRLKATTSPFERIGRLLATAVATPGTRHVGAAPGSTAMTIRQTLSGAGLLTLPSGDTPMAAYVVLVLGDTRADPDQVTGVDPVLTAVTTGLGAGSARLVVAGDSTSAAGGPLAGLRAAPLGPHVSTVDSDQVATGQVAVVLALIRGRAGAFGVSGSSGAAPLG